MEFQFDQEKYPRGAIAEMVDEINLDYQCEPLTSQEVYLNHLKSQWPKEGTYDYFKIEGSGYDGELSSVYINFYKAVPETDEQYARRVYRRIEKHEKRKKEYEWFHQREEQRMKKYILENKDEVKKILDGEE